MGDVLRIGEPPIVVRLRRHARARRLVLRIPAPGRDPTLTLPPRASVASARGFLDAQEGWLRARLAAVAPPVRIGEGTRLPILGETVVVRLGSGSGVREREGELRVGGPADGCGASVARHLQRTARDFAAAAAARHAARLGRGHGRISLRDTRSRWGSCSATGDLMFSWRLVLAPVEVFDYVVAHEVAHLLEMNHSARFWAQVRSLRPDYPAPRRWLRGQGATLHRFDFSDPAREDPATA